ncbi:MAG: GNAT family N-acetyltransferase [Anaerolineales bacterium]|nr:GNAT family N-acetyltransferase [Anaerolineales bacterium]
MEPRVLNPRKRADRASFIQFPFELYKDNPYWTPPFNWEMQLLFRKWLHPFYSHSDAEFIVVEEDGKVLGRIAVLYNQNYSKAVGIPSALFYYFDVVEDYQAAETLLNFAVEQARLHGVKRIFGPKGFLRSDGSGVLVEGFEHIPAYWMVYNYPYYDEYLKRFGFTKVVDYLSGTGDIDTFDTERFEKITNWAQKRNGFEVITFKNKLQMLMRIPEVEKVHTKAFASDQKVIPSTTREFLLMGIKMITIMRPEMQLLVEKDHEIIGFGFMYPNICRSLRETKGKLLPFGWIKILREYRHPVYLDCNGIGVLPQYQGLGANAAMYTKAVKFLKDNNIKGLEMIQAAETNFQSRSDMEQMKVHWFKTHRVYEYLVE